MRLARTRDDEVVHVHVVVATAEHRVRVVSRRYEERSLSTCLPNASCATTLIDRAAIISIEGKSYRRGTGEAKKGRAKTE